MNARDLLSLRDAILTAAAAETRAAAILRLDADGAQRLLPHLHDATQDPSMRVREAAFAALARAGDLSSLSRAAAACAHDRSFRVRRMAALYAARTCGRDALPVLALASLDPFWRVRVAARRAAGAVGAPVDARPSPSAATVSIRGADDPDPAVVAARLERMRHEVDPGLLVGLLGHPHRALRRIAVAEIAARGDVATLRAVTRWLVDERVPYAPAAAEAVLARAGATAAAVAAALLIDETAAGPLAWAIVATDRAPVWSHLRSLLVHPDPRVRRAASLRVPEAAPDRATLLATIARLLADEDEETRRRAAGWLARSRGHDARALLLQLDPRGQPTFVRLLLIEIWSDVGDVDALRRLADDPHGAVRRAALSALATLRELTNAERSVLARDPDPGARAAAVIGAGPDAQTAWALATATSGDPDGALRARAAAVLTGVATEAATRALLLLARDADPGVRSVAVGALDGRRHAARRLLLDGTLDVDQRIAAYTLLRLEEDGDDSAETDPRARAHLALLADVRAGREPSSVPATPSRTAPPSSAARRELGRSGIRVQPFGLSGAHDLSFGDWARAHARGVDLFFWEPRHRQLRRFLRSRTADTVVVAGTYHADEASIERDAVAALRALRRDSIDVFLAFWARSSARIDAVADVLRRLGDRGLIRATGISTHDRTLACEAADRGLDVVMVRHNAAHRGAEATVLPRCVERGTGVLTFSNLCYGRMLHRTPATLTTKVTAADCYRYSLSQPGVHGCIAAPRRHSELVEDLDVVGAPPLDDARMRELRAHGDHVYARSKAWSADAFAGDEVDDSVADWIDRPESISPPVW